MIHVRKSLVSALAVVALYAAAAPRVRATDVAPRDVKAQTTSSIVVTLAGGGSVDGYAADAANLALGGSQGLAVAANGDIYFSDSGHHQVLKLDPATGLVAVVAGNGSASYGGDGLSATAASLDSPAALTFDAAGNLLIADRGNFVVRRVDAASGVITTIAGTGLFTGQVVGSSPPAALGDGGAATAATFGNLGDLAVDAAGAVIVCDSGNSCVRKFVPGGTIIAIAGTPGSAAFGGDGVVGGALSAKFNAPSGVTIDGSGAVFIADSGNRRVRRLGLDATVTTVAGSGSGGSSGFSGDGGPATSAQIGSLGALTFDKSGSLLVACIGANRVRKVDVVSLTPVMTTIAGNGGADVLGDGGPATGSTLSAPRDLALAATGDVLVLDAGHRRIRRIDATTGFIDTVAGDGLVGFVGDRGPKQGGVLSNPGGASFDAAGNLYVADTGNNSVRRIATDGTITTFAGAGTASGLGDGGLARLASLSGPQDVLVVGSTLFIADSGNDRVRAVDLATGLIRTYAVVSGPVAMVAGPSGVLFVAHDDQVDTVDLVGSVTPFAGDNPVDTGPNPLGDGLPATNASLSSPSGLALSAAGELFIADTAHDRVRKIGIAPGLIVSTVAGGGAPAFPSIGDGGAATAASLSNPSGVAVDATRLLIADTGNHRIRSVSGGVITTICGDGKGGFVGDGDLAANAEVNSPGRVFFNGTNIAFADSDNNRVRQIVSAIDIDPKRLAVSARLSFVVDRKTGRALRGRDAVSVKAGLPLPDGIDPSNLVVSVDVVDLHQQTQFDVKGRQPKPTKPAASTTTPFDFQQPTPPARPTSRYALALRKTSVADAKPAAFAFSSAGTFGEELGRAGFTDVTTPKTGVETPVRVNVTLGGVTFTGLATTVYRATQGRIGAVATKRP